MRIIACMASTLDGKIGPAGAEHYVRITSDQDIRHLMKIRDTADAILFGASTFRAYPRVHRGYERNHKPVHIILSRSIALDYSTPLFEDPSIPVIIMSPMKTEKPEHHLPAHVEFYALPESNPPDQVAAIVDHLEKRSIQTLLIEGGGHILSLFISSGHLQELYLTLSPKIIHDARAPQLFSDSVEIQRLPEFELISSQKIENEIYMHFRLKYPGV